MIILRLQGGLGNQMFQYATARRFSDHKLYFDTSFLKQNKFNRDDFTARIFELDFFKNLKNQKINNSLLRLLLTQNPKYDLVKSIFPKKYKILKKISDRNINSVLKLEEALHLFQGDFQNPKIFEDNRDNLLKEFKFPELPNELKILQAEINESNSVSIHVRRTDYITQSSHNILLPNYYESAIKKFKNLTDNTKFYVFSDDIDWCRSNLDIFSLDIQFISNSHLPAWTDMALMSLCKHNIIANSTFSWWSAWLNANEKKIVIAPKKWNNLIDKNSKPRIVPDNWLLV